MKLISFNCAIELSKGENGYSNNCYIDVTDKGVTISHIYDVQTPEQAMFVTNLIHDFIAQAIAFNNRVNGFNNYNQLEQYASQAPSTEVSSSESTDVSAVPQSCAPGGEEVSTGTVTMDEAKTPEQMLEAMIASGERKEVRDLPM